MIFHDELHNVFHGLVVLLPVAFACFVIPVVESILERRGGATQWTVNMLNN